MSRRQRIRDVLLLREVPGIQTDAGLACYRHRCRCGVVSRSKSTDEMCRLSESKDLHQRQQQIQYQKPQSVFDYFYDQLYSTKKQDCFCDKCSTPTCCCNAETKPFDIGSTLRMNNLPEAPQQNSKNLKQKGGVLSRFNPNVRVSGPEFGSGHSLGNYDDTRTTHGRIVGRARHQNKVLPAFGVSIGFFEVYLAQGTRPKSEDSDARHDFLGKAFGLGSKGVLGDGKNNQTRKREHCVLQQHKAVNNSDRGDKSHAASYRRGNRKITSRRDSTCSESSNESRKASPNHSKQYRQKRLPLSRSKSKSRSLSDLSSRRSSCQWSSARSRIFSDDSRESRSSARSPDQSSTSASRNRSRSSRSFTDRRSNSTLSRSRSNSSCLHRRSNSTLNRSRSNSSCLDRRSNSTLSRSRSNSSCLHRRSNSTLNRSRSNSSCLHRRSNSTLNRSRSNSSCLHRRSNSTFSRSRTNSFGLDRRTNSTLSRNRGNSSCLDRRSNSTISRSRSNSSCLHRRSNSTLRRKIRKTSCFKDRQRNKTFRKRSKSTNSSPNRRNNSTSSTSLSPERRRKTGNARAPSIRRRRGSPCHLDKRRITSARKRPVPYTRPEPLRSSSSSSRSDSSRSSQTQTYSSKSCFQSLSRSTSSDIHQERLKPQQNSDGNHLHHHHERQQDTVSSPLTTSTKPFSNSVDILPTSSLI